MAELHITLTEMFKAHILDVHVPNILIGITGSIEVPLITIVGRAIKADHSQIAKFVLLSAICRTALDIPVGVIVEYVGVRNVMLACLVINVLAALLGAHIGGFGAMGVFCALSGISLGGFFLARHIFVAGISSKKYRGLLMSFLSGLLRWSHVVGPLLTGIVASRTGDTRNAFYIAALTSFLSFVSIIVAHYSTQAKEQCDRSCLTSRATSITATPAHTDADEPVMPEGSGGGSGNSAPHTAASAAAAATSAVVIGDESRPLVPPLAPLRGRSSHEHSTNNSIAYMSRAAGEGAGEKVHRGMGAGEIHFFRPSALWYTVVDYWPIIWRLGIYIVFFGALRSNRKLLIMFAGMRQNMTDAQVSYLLSISFVFSAVLFPLGGIIMDFMGRNVAMAPVALGLALCFFVLPLCTTHTHLYVVSCAFGIADAMGCGVVMTLTADRAPKVYGAPFFGIMRTLADLGHVVGAGGVSFLVRVIGHNGTCLVLAAVGLFTALWGVLGVPRDMEPMETPRLDRAIAKHEKEQQPQQQGEHSEGWEERPLLASNTQQQQQQQQQRGSQNHTYGAV